RHQFAARSALRPFDHREREQQRPVGRGCLRAGGHPARRCLGPQRSRLLEVGCGPRPNLFLLARFPGGQLNLDASFRVFCSDGLSNLAFNQTGIGEEGGGELLVFTAPTTATYYLRVASYTQGTGRTGVYRVRTT